MGELGFSEERNDAFNPGFLVALDALIQVVAVEQVMDDARNGALMGESPEASRSLHGFTREALDDERDHHDQCCEQRFG